MGQIEWIVYMVVNSFTRERQSGVHTFLNSLIEMKFFEKLKSKTTKAARIYC